MKREIELTRLCFYLTTFSLFVFSNPTELLFFISDFVDPWDFIVAVSVKIFDSEREHFFCLTAVQSDFYIFFIGTLSLLIEADIVDLR